MYAKKWNAAVNVDGLTNPVNAQKKNDNNNTTVKGPRLLEKKEEVWTPLSITNADH